MKEEISLENYNYRAKVYVVEIKGTLGYELYAYGKTEAQARKNLKKRTKGYYYVDSSVDVIKKTV